jgi:uncharacterized damage-inducible protein DinB
MSLKDALLAEFDQETASTRKVLERIPERGLAWKPHEKSMSFGQLAAHLAEVPGWTVPTLTQESLDLNPPGGESYKTPDFDTRQEILDLFDANIAQARTALAQTGDEAFMVPWTLLSGGQAFFTLPRAAVMRGFVMNHMIHHRAQLTVYLRLNDIPVPSVYGPSADEAV